DDPALVQPLIEVFRDHPSESVKNEIRELLSTLKVSAGESVLLDALKSDENTAIQGDLLYFLWHSGFQPVDDLHTVAKIAIEGEFMTAFEALTLIESIGGPVNESSLMDALMVVRDWLSANKEHPNREVVFSIFQALSVFENQG
ncbi:MAG: hypothetical protein RL226_104, partial [Bacteroidota bacterium]